MSILRNIVATLAFALLAWLSSGCNDETLQTPGGLEIYGLGADTLVRGDELVIYGTGFGLRSDSSFVLVGSVPIPSAQCRTWTDAIVRVALADTIASDSVCIVIGRDTTKKRFLEIIPLPPFAMVEIPAGSFQMGSKAGLAGEMPVHSVSISKPFFASALEVPQGLWWRVMRTKPVAQYDESLPVASIAWADAIRFCNAISKIYGYDTCYEINGSKVEFIDTANGFRLPTEAEWEYVARAGSAEDFAGSGLLADMGWYSGNSGGLLKRGGQKAANAFGLYDVHGNVREYCWDWYSETYYAASPATDPQGPATGGRRVSRGGSYSEGMLACRLPARLAEDTSSAFCGLRLFRNK